MKRMLIAILLVVLLAACTPGGANQDESYAVYRAVIQAKYLGPDIQRVVIEKNTAADDNLSEDRLKYAEQGLKGLDDNTLGAFRTANRQPAELQDRFGLSVPVVLVDKKQLDESFAASGWDGFYQAYPNSPGVITFSKVGINRTGDKAMVYVGCQSHYLAGSGYYLLLEKKDGQWSIVEELMAWIS